MTRKWTKAAADELLDAAYDRVLEEADALCEVNHCHGKGSGHPCGAGGGSTAPKKYPIVHAGSPLRTNADINRGHAMTAFKAGMTPAHIAKEWPAVFTVDKAGKLGQKYDYELGDGSGRLETKRMITRDSVSAAIKRFKAVTKTGLVTRSPTSRHI